MSTEPNKATAHFFIEAYNSGNLTTADEIFAADFVSHTLTPGTPHGWAGFKQALATFRTAFPDSQFTAEDTITEGNKVVTRVTFHGTHHGNLGDFNPTGKRVTMTGIEIYRIADSKIAEHWGNGDDLGMMQQLGEIP